MPRPFLQSNVSRTVYFLEGHAEVMRETACQVSIYPLWYAYTCIAVVWLSMLHCKFVNVVHRLLKLVQCIQKSCG